MAKKDKVQMAVIAGAAQAIKYKEENPKASESEIMSYVTKRMKRIINDLEGDF